MVIDFTGPKNVYRPVPERETLIEGVQSIDMKVCVLRTKIQNSSIVKRAHTSTINRKRRVTFRPNVIQYSPTLRGEPFFPRQSFSPAPPTPWSFHSESSARTFRDTLCTSRSSRIYYCARSTANSRRRTETDPITRYATHPDRVKPCPAEPSLSLGPSTGSGQSSVLFASSATP